MSMMSDASALAQRRVLEAASFWGESPAARDYWEDFTRGSRGWIADSRSPLPVGPDGARCQGPWVVDANHAPPGAGYLHLLMHIHTLEERLHAPYAKAANMYPEDFLRAGRHAFIHGGRSRNLTNARIRVHMRGELEARGAKVSVLVQGQAGPRGPRGNWILSGQSLAVSSEGAHQELTLLPDPSQWTFLGSRHDLTGLYGYVSIEEVLADVNVSFIFVLFPLSVEPQQYVPDKDRAWAGRDYAPRQDLLPSGFVEFQSVWFRYPKEL